MKHAITIIFLVFTSVSLAQQSPISTLNYKKSTDDVLFPQSPKLLLNLDSFKLEDTSQNTHSLSEFLRESYQQRVKLASNMPIFEPKGKFYLEIFSIDDDIDYKLKIFDLEKSN